MEAATKKKRGRPKSANTIAAEMVFTEKETRAAQNLLYAMTCIDKIGGRNNPFFTTAKGNIRRQGIAEQLGRMLEADLITVEQAKELAQWAIDDYNSGASVKQIESTLRLYKQTLQNAERGGKWLNKE